jgi:hypothetical protein
MSAKVLRRKRFEGGKRGSRTPCRLTYRNLARTRIA